MKVFTPLLLLIASAGLLYLFDMPHYENVKAFTEQRNQYDEAIVRAESVDEKRNDLVNRKNSLSADGVKRLQKLLPDSINNIRLVVDVNNIALRYGSPIQNIKIETPNVQTEIPNTIGADNKPYGTLNLDFSVSMTYDQFQKFLKDLEKSLRIMEVSSITLKPDEKSSVYTYTVKLTTYWLK